MPNPILLEGFAQGLGLANGASGFIDPVKNAVSGTFNFMSPNARPDVGTLVHLSLREEISDTDYKKFMQFNGFSDDWAIKIRNASYIRLNALDYINLWRRKLITDEEYKKKMSELGFMNNERINLELASLYFPTPQDLIQFAVRDVFTQETVEKYQLFSDVPERFLEESEKAGLPKDQALNYWGAHWQLPSLGNVTEMLHRRIINPDEYKEFLKVNDYSPNWRQKIEDISYQPLTRVDVRRMYEIGVIDQQKVYENFLDLGYNEENANLMTAFTTIYDAPETKGLTRTTITSAFVEGHIDIHEMVELLGSIGFQNPMLTFWIEEAQYKKAKSIIDLQIDSIYEMYLVGGSGLDTFRTSLYQMDLPSQQVETLIKKAILKRDSQRKIPDLTTLVRWLEKGIIDEKVFRLRMQMLNYDEQDILFYLQEISEKQDTSQRKYLKDTVYVRWLENNIIDEKYFDNIMREQGFGEIEILSYKLEIRSRQSADK